MVVLHVENGNRTSANLAVANHAHQQPPQRCSTAAEQHLSSCLVAGGGVRGRSRSPEPAMGQSTGSVSPSATSAASHLQRGVLAKSKAPLPVPQGPPVIMGPGRSNQSYSPTVTPTAPVAPVAPVAPMAPAAPLAPATLAVAAGTALAIMQAAYQVSGQLPAKFACLAQSQFNLYTTAGRLGPHPRPPPSSKSQRSGQHCSAHE